MSQWPPALEDAHAALVLADDRHRQERSIESMTALELARSAFDTAMVDWQHRQRRSVLDELEARQ